MTASNATIRIGSCLVNTPVAISQLDQRIFQTFQSGFFQVRASRKEMLGARFSVSQLSYFASPNISFNSYSIGPMSYARLSSKLSLLLK